MQVLHLSEALRQLTMANCVHWYGHMLMRGWSCVDEGYGHVLMSGMVMC